MKKNKTMIFLFILPTVLCLLFMYVYPVVRTVIMSFFKVESLTATTSTWSFYGLQNYFKILRNAGFISSMKNMVMIWLVGGIITMCLSMLMAVTSFRQVTAMLVELKPQIFKKEVFCIGNKGFNQRDAYRVMLRKYPDVMNIEQMCDALRISTKTGYKLLHEGKIPAMKIGRSYRIPKAHLFTYLQICGQHCRAENRQC